MRPKKQVVLPFLTGSHLAGKLLGGPAISDTVLWG
jgi:hypothetical protein